MVTSPLAADNSDVKPRLLEAAGEIFARDGYHAATVRDICEHASVNIAAIHYYFGGKEQLYAAAFQHLFELGLQRFPPDWELPPDAGPEEALRAFIRAFLYRLLSEGRPSWHGKLMAWELVQPTPVLPTVAARYIVPLQQHLQRLVETLAGPRAGAAAVQRLCGSIIGQCVFYRHCQPMLKHLEAIAHWDTPTLEQLTDHIARFSLAGIRALAGAGEEYRKGAKTEKERKEETA